jgi:hypothetical protein
MKKYLKEIIAILICVAVFVAPLTTHALLPDFGGRSVSLWPCTCSGAIWLWFVPLHLQGVPVTGPMTFYPATLQFSDYLGGAPGIEYLGKYVPGVQACWIYAGYFCFPLPSVGVMAVIGTGP